MEGRGAAAGAEVCGEQVGALGACGAGAGAIAAVMGLLFIVHRYQLQEEVGEWLLNTSDQTTVEIHNLQHAATCFRLEHATVRILMHYDCNTT